MRASAAHSYVFVPHTISSRAFSSFCAFFHVRHAHSHRHFLQRRHQLRSSHVVSVLVSLFWLRLLYQVSRSCAGTRCSSLFTLCSTLERCVVRTEDCRESVFEPVCAMALVIRLFGNRIPVRLCRARRVRCPRSPAHSASGNSRTADAAARFHRARMYRRYPSFLCLRPFSRRVRCSHTPSCDND